MTGPLSPMARTLGKPSAFFFAGFWLQAKTLRERFIGGLLDHLSFFSASCERRQEASPS